MSSAADYYGAAAVPPTTAYGPPKLDFSDLTGGLDAFVKGSQQGRAEDAATAFRNGIPKDKVGNPDYNAMYQKMLELGAYDDAAKLASSGIQLQQYSNSNNLPAPPGGAPIAAPQSAMPAPQRGPVGPAANSGDRPGSIIGALTDAGVPTDQIGMIAGRLGSALKIDPNNPMTPQEPTGDFVADMTTGRQYAELAVAYARSKADPGFIEFVLSAMNIKTLIAEINPGGIEYGFFSRIAQIAYCGSMN